MIFEKLTLLELALYTLTDYARATEQPEIFELVKQIARILNDDDAPEMIQAIANVSEGISAETLIEEVLNEIITDRDEMG